MTEKIKIVYLNLVDQDSTVITGSTEDPFYPASNIKDPRTTKKYRSTGTSANVVFDFVTTEAVDTIMVRGDALDGRGFTGTLTIEANATDSWGAPSYSNTLTFDDEHNIGFLTLSSAESYRFWRISGSGSSFFELSNVCMGQAFIPGRNMTTRFSYLERDLSSKTQNEYGQFFITEKNRRDEMNIEFKFLTKEQTDDFMTMFDAVGESKPIWVIPDNSEFFSLEKERFASQFYINDIPRYNHSIKGLYNISMRLIEVI